MTAPFVTTIEQFSNNEDTINIIYCVIVIVMSCREDVYYIVVQQ